MKKISEKLKKEIHGIPDGGGWHKRSSEDIFCQTAQEMADKGFIEDDILDLLAELYCAVAACYSG